MADMDIEEAVAEALWKRAELADNPSATWDAKPDWLKLGYRKDARAALAVMRERMENPTPYMAAAAPVRIWRAMAASMFDEDRRDLG